MFGRATATILVAFLSILYRWHPPQDRPLPSFDFLLENNLTSSKSLLAIYPPDFYPNGAYLSLPHGRMRYYQLESNDFDQTKEQQVIVMVHGIGSSAPVFNRLARNLVAVVPNCRVLLYDMYGRGYSDSPGTFHDDALYVSQLSMLLAHLDIRRFHLVGYSLGGAIATSFASYFPEELKSLILIAPAGLMDEIPLIGQIFSAPLVGEILLSSGIAPILMKKNAQSNFLVLPPPGESEEESCFRAWNRTDATVEDDVAHLLALTYFQVDHHPGFRRSFLSTTRHFPLTRTQRIIDRFKKVGELSQLPVLVIWGTRDTLIPIKLWGYLKQSIPHASLQSVHNGGHSIVAENATAVFNIIMSHIDSLETS